MLQDVLLFYKLIFSDIDECAIGTSGCSQLCNNTIGSYVCLCNPGYQLSSDNKACIGEHLLKALKAIHENLYDILLFAPM